MDKQLLESLKIAFRIITPWKKQMYGNTSVINNAYTNGWNACLKQIKKNRAKFLKELKEKITGIPEK
jgi:hypothetical protein